MKWTNRLWGIVREAHKPKVVPNIIIVIYTNLTLISKTTCPFTDTILLPTRNTNSGRQGVWVYEIGASPYFFAVTPGMVSSLPEASRPPATMLPRQPDEQQEVDFTTYGNRTSMITEAAPESGEEFPAEAPTESQTNYPEEETITPGLVTQETGEAEQERLDPVESETPTYTNPEPIQPAPPADREQHHQIVVVDEDLDVNGTSVKLKIQNKVDLLQPVGFTHRLFSVFAYSLETCASNRHRCSSYADCRDYSDGYCCHCRPGFYGNGKDCVAEGQIHSERMFKRNDELFLL